MGYSGVPDDVANAGVSSVPQFTPPVNPATPIHHGILGKILGGLQQAGGAIGNTLSPVPSAMQGLLSPTDLQHAKSAGWLALGSSLLNPTLDARGFKQSFLGSAAQGLQNGQQASEGSIGNALQASQYAQQQAQTQRVQQTRQQIGSTILPQFASEPDKDKQINLLQQAAIASDANGDKDGAKNYMELAKAVHEGRVSAQNAYQYLKTIGGVLQIDKATGANKEVFKDPLEQRILAQRDKALATADTNSTLKDQSMYNNGPGKEFAKARAAYDNFDAVADELEGANGAKPNPAALRKFTSAFGQAAAPQIQYRLGTLMYEEPLDVSIRGRLKALAANVENGTADKTQIEDARHLVATLRARTASREAEVARAFAKKSPHGFDAVRTDLNPQFNEDGSQDAPTGGIDMTKF